MIVTMEYYYRKNNDLYFRNKPKKMSLIITLPIAKINELIENQKLKRGHFYDIKMEGKLNTLITKDDSYDQTTTRQIKK